MSSQVGKRFHEAIPCPEMHSTISDSNMQITRVTGNLDNDAHVPAMHSSHALFTPDSKRCVFMRQVGAGTDEGGQGKMVFTLCDIEDDYALYELTDEDNVRGPVISRDGKCMYYWVDDGAASKPKITLKQIDLDTFKRETLLVIDAPVEGVGRVPRGGHMYCGSSLRRDGKRLSSSCSFFEDDPMYASLIVNLEDMTAYGFQFEKYNWRPFGTYYRGDDPRYLDHLTFGHSHHRSGMGTDGKWYAEPDGTGVNRCTLHVLNDQGQDLGMAVPIGADGEGVDHPIWRGGKFEICTHTSSTTTAPHWRCTILTAAPVKVRDEDKYKGAAIPGAKRVELTRHLKRPEVCHHSWDQSGTRVVADTEGWAGRGTPVPSGPSAYLWIGTVVESAGEDPYLVPKHLLHPKSSWTGSYWTEVQPSMSPDCKTVFFNSDWLCKTGHPQVFAVRGFEFPKG